MKKSSILLAIIAVLFASCSHQYYVPVNHNVPLLDKKGDLNASLHYGGSNDVDLVIEGQAAYALSNNVGLTLSGFYASGADTELKTDPSGNRFQSDNGRGSGVEVGAGYFMPLLQRGMHTLQGEVYGGLGFSSQLHHYTSDQSMYKYHIGMQALKFFVQPSFGYKMRYFEAMINARISSFNRNSLEITGTPTSVDVDELQKVDVQHSWFIEPSLTLRGGLPYLKFQLQLIGLQSLSKRTVPYENG